MKQSLIASLLFHAAFMILVALAPGFNKRPLIRVEKIIPVNVIHIPLPAPPSPLVPGKAPPSPVKEPLDRPTPAPARTPPRTAPPLPAQRTIEVPDLVSRLEPTPPPQASLKEKIQNRFQKREPAPEVARPRSEPRPAVPPPPAPRESVPPATSPALTPALSPQPRPPTPTVTLEAATFPHAWYVSIVQNQIYENWTPPQRLLVIKPGAGAYVRFTIRRDGGISEVALKESSGYTLLDRSALEAVKRLTGLPPLPADYKENVLHVVVFFRPLTD